MMKIRAAQPGDEDSLKRIMRASIRSECAAVYGLETVKAWTAEDNTRFDFRIPDHTFVAEEEGRLLAFSGWRENDGARVSAAFVTPDNIRRGLGRILLQRIEDDIRDHGFEEAYLLASLNAVPFYRDAGYEYGAKEALTVADGYHVSILRMNKILAVKSAKRCTA